MRSELDPRLRIDHPGDGICRLTIASPEAHNAQDTALIDAIDQGLMSASRDPGVRVIIVAAQGKHFSSGHDLKERNIYAATAELTPRGSWVDDTGIGIEPQMGREIELYLGMCERWRNLAKPTIAQVQGGCIAGGLTLAWPCDLIVAADDAWFMDPTVALGVNGHEYFVHALELGVRKAKEFLFTGMRLSAAEALACGMVNRVVPLDQLEAETLALATRIAQQPVFALKLTKMAVNAAEDAMGRSTTLKTSFALHQLAHSQNMQVHGCLVDPAGLGPALSDIDLANISGRRRGAAASDDE